MDRLEFAAQGPQPLLVPGDQHKVVSVVRQLPRELAANACGGSGDEGDRHGIRWAVASCCLLELGAGLLELRAGAAGAGLHQGLSMVDPRPGESPLRPACCPCNLLVPLPEPALT